MSSLLNTSVQRDLHKSIKTTQFHFGCLKRVQTLSLSHDFSFNHQTVVCGKLRECRYSFRLLLKKRIVWFQLQTELRKARRKQVRVCRFKLGLYCIFCPFWQYICLSQAKSDRICVDCISRLMSKLTMSNTSRIFGLALQT